MNNKILKIDQKVPRLLVKKAFGRETFGKEACQLLDCWPNGRVKIPVLTKQCVKQMIIGQMSVGKMSVGQIPFFEMSNGQMPFGKFLMLKCQFAKWL